VTGDLSPHAQVISIRLKGIIAAASADGRRTLNAEEEREVTALIERLDADDLLRIIAARSIG
jgi:hypothetical protein